MIKKIVTFIILILILLLTRYNTKKVSEEKHIEIKKGETISNIANKLYENNIISNKLIFRIDSKLRNTENMYKYGKIKFDKDDNINNIIDKLIQGGKAETIKVSIPEGYTIREMMEKLKNDGLINEEKFIQALNKEYDYEFISDIPKRNNRYEGYLYPSTYEHYKNYTEEDIVRKMLTQFQKVYTDEYKKRAEELNFSMDEVIKIASIIEKEVRVDEEQKKVAGVIYNRLEKNRKLQMCSTVQYILPERRDRLLDKDLLIDSPYNTYMYPGLPKGPVGNPGKKAIEAALYPEEHEYYYFVVKDTQKGIHHFSKTLREHNIAKAKYYNN